MLSAIFAIDVVTVCVIVILIGGFLGGIRRGLVVATLNVVATIAALAIACSRYGLVGRLIGFIINLDVRTSAIAGFVVSFVAMSVVTHVFAKLLARLLQTGDITTTDRLMGGAVSLVCVCIVVSIAICLVLCGPVDALASHVTRSQVSVTLATFVPTLLRGVGLGLPEFLDWNAAKPGMSSSHT